MNEQKEAEQDLFQQVRTAAAEVHSRRFCAAVQVMYGTETAKMDPADFGK